VWIRIRVRVRVTRVDDVVRADDGDGETAAASWEIGRWARVRAQRPRIFVWVAQLRGR
jgi:hypothetical protein